MPRRLRPICDYCVGIGVAGEWWHWLVTLTSHVTTTSLHCQCYKFSEYFYQGYLCTCVHCALCLPVTCVAFRIRPATSHWLYGLQNTPVFYDFQMPIGMIGFLSSVINAPPNRQRFLPHTKMAHILFLSYSVFFQPHSTSEPITINNIHIIDLVYRPIQCKNL